MLSDFWSTVSWIWPPRAGFAPNVLLYPAACFYESAEMRFLFWKAEEFEPALNGAVAHGKPDWENSHPPPKKKT